VFGAERHLPRLPASRTEAQGVAAITSSSQLLLGASASEAAFKRLARPGVRVLHLATHAVVSDGGLDGSTLALSAGAGEDGEVGVTEIVRLDLDADLVVLSACRTAGGRILWGEGLQGLTAPFLEAGARNVLATRWPVRDSELLPLMTSLYMQLGAGASVGDAVRRVRLDALARGDGPRRWASLQLTGDGRAIPLPQTAGRGVHAVVSVRSKMVGPRIARSSHPRVAP
jgi:CHAT domain-containing protein